MLFSSMSFIYLFLPVVCLLYFLVRANLRNYVLLGASIFFYAWGEPEYLAIMLLTILVHYVGGLLIDKYPKYKKLSLALTITVDLGFLAYFKYFNFFIENINLLLKGGGLNFIEVIMPIGISFYTFQAISYAVDVYRGDVKVQQDIGKLALFICLFPQLIAGPILKYNDIAHQIDSREVNPEKVTMGVKRFIIGLSKKVLLANTLGAVADKIFDLSPDLVQTSIAWVGSLAYSFQLFFDFSGYSDMAVGLGLIFGFHIKDNFNYPYISKSITEFWRRWHISLSTWFKEYLYIPLGGNRVSKPRNYFNLAVVFLLTGFWHGAAWNFVVWGIWHGLFIIFEKVTGWHKENSRQWINPVKHLYTIFVFIIGWVMFRAENLSYAWQYIKNMFGLAGNKTILYEAAYYFDNIEIIAFIAALLCSVPLFSNMLNIPQERKWLRWLVNAWLLFLFILSTSAIAASTYNPFIYFRF